MDRIMVGELEDIAFEMVESIKEYKQMTEEQEAHGKEIDKKVAWIIEKCRKELFEYEDYLKKRWL